MPQRSGRTLRHIPEHDTIMFTDKAGLEYPADIPMHFLPQRRTQHPSTGRIDRPPSNQAALIASAPAGFLFSNDPGRFYSTPGPLHPHIPSTVDHITEGDVKKNPRGPPAIPLQPVSALVVSNPGFQNQHGSRNRFQSSYQHPSQFQVQHRGSNQHGYQQDRGRGLGRSQTQHGP